MPDTALTDKVAPLNKSVMLSHGTITCKSLAASRRFYEEFLGLDVVQHTERGVLLRKGGYCVIVCLEVGEHVSRSIASIIGVSISLRAKRSIAPWPWRMSSRTNTASIRSRGSPIITAAIRSISAISTIIIGSSSMSAAVKSSGNGRYDQFFARGDVTEKNKPAWDRGD